MLRRSPHLAALLLSAILVPGTAAPQEPATLVIAVVAEATTPVPTLWNNRQDNRELSDLLFLRLADLGPSLRTTDERSFVPRLARRWTRPDRTTLVFELDPRATWEDGVPVTAQDVVFALNRARDPRLSPQTATLLRRLKSVEPDGDRRVIAHFTEWYPEQFYDVTYHAPPLPAHLLQGIPPDSLATSAFVSHPVGDGPYRFVRRSPGQQIELEANDNFFLGRPGIGRILFLIVPDPEARVNLLQNGDVDALDNIYSLPNWSRVEHLPNYQYYPVPGSTLIYANFNQRDPADTSRPHPLFADPALRRALIQALDRPRMVHAAYGPLVQTPSGPLSALLNRSVDSPPDISFDTALARRALAQDGWTDREADGTLRRGSQPLRFRIMVPSAVAAWVNLATQMQEAWRRIGVAADLDLVDRPVFVARRNAGQFDLAMYGAAQDPSPSGLVQSWTCAGIGGSNVSHYCDPAVDSLLDRASRADPGQSGDLYSAAVRRIAADAPAIFLAAAVYGTPVHRRFTNVTIRPESTWSLVWQWRIKPGEQLERDRR